MYECVTASIAYPRTHSRTSFVLCVYMWHTRTTKKSTQTQTLLLLFETSTTRTRTTERNYREKTKKTSVILCFSLHSFYINFDRFVVYDHRLYSIIVLFNSLCFKSFRYSIITPKRNESTNHYRYKWRKRNEAKQQRKKSLDSITVVNFQWWLSKQFVVANNRFGVFFFFSYGFICNFHFISIHSFCPPSIFRSECVSIDIDQCGWRVVFLWRNSIIVIPKKFMINDRKHTRKIGETKEIVQQIN